MNYQSDKEAIKRYDKKLKAAFKLLQPPPDITISEWADVNRKLSREAAAEVGRWSTDRTPYLRDVMDAICDASIERVTLMCASQVGKTETLLNVIGYYISYDPAPIMVVQPTLDMAMAFSKDRLSPMLRDSKGLGDKMLDQNKRGSVDNTILGKHFLGGSVNMVGANSPASLAGRPIRILLADEVDRYPISAGAEGSPLKLAMKRTTNYYNRKIVAVSTPTVRNLSTIEALYNDSDKRQYHIPCPKCGHFQTLKWSNLHFDKENLNDVYYLCDGCQAHLTDSDKYKMLGNGKWISENPLVKHHAGFWLNGLYSPFEGMTWPKVASDFLEAKQSRDTLRVFINTTLAETWDDAETLDIKHETLISKIEDYDKLPEGVYLLTAGVDIQDTYIIVVVYGWGLKEESWVVDWQQIMGTTVSPDTWDKLDEILNKEYETEQGIRLKIASTAIDSGYMTDGVYSYAKKNEYRRVYAIKGLSQDGLPVVSKFSIRGKQKAKLFYVGVDGAKAMIYDRLRNENFGPGYIHFKKDICTEDFLKQLTSEKLEKKFVRGFPKLQWVKVRNRNEVLDCTVYSLAAYRILNPDMETIKAKIEAQLGITQETPEEMKTEPEKKQEYSVVTYRPHKNQDGFVNRY